MRLNVFVLALLTLIAGFLASCGGNGDEPSAAIFSGRVVALDTSVYLGGVNVSVEGGGPSTVTDSIGYFELGGLTLDRKTIVFEKEGFQKKEYDFNYIGNLKRPIISDLIIMLRPGETMPVDTVADTTAADSM